MQVDKGRHVWEHIVWSTFSFKEYKYWSRNRELQIRCKQPSWKSFANIELGADTTADQPTRVWREEAEIQVYQEELEQMKLAAIFANECPRDFLSFSKPGIDSCIYIYMWRIQRDLADRMMRMMRTGRTTFSGNKMPAGLDENLNLEPQPKLKVGIPSQHCQMEQMLQMTREAQLSMDWTHPIRCIRLRAWVFVEALSRRPWQSSWFHEVQESWVYMFRDKLCSNLLDLVFGKPPPEEAFYNTQVVFFEDHQLKIKGHENNEESSRKAKEDIEFKKEALQARWSFQPREEEWCWKEGRSRQEAGRSEGEESTGKG